MSNALSKDLRNQLARVTLAAREAAERGARAALEHLAVHEKDYRVHMTVEARQLRNRLRARGRALGDVRDERTGTQEITRLVEDAAYEHWHRLLFTRFLAENHLLHTDAAHGTVPVTIAECEELASELGARDGFELACRFASETLPGVFRRDDPVLELRLAPNDEVALRKLLDSLPTEVFQADDALGWTYQFWQAKRKDEVNASGKKIGADELPAVTQLFTEDYMVEFLLHNTLGAWWAGKRGPVTAPTEEDARRAVALPGKDGLPAISWTYLRFIQDEATKTWRAATGTFDGWPKAAKDIRFLDPCMGSGHFPVFALLILARLRMEGEQVTAAQAVYATLRDNLYGLEIDPRCTQIGAFNLALTAWKVAGWQALPPFHIACCGLAPRAKLADWVKLAGNDDRKRRGMEQLYRLFEQAPELGSLINPLLARGDIVEADYQELAPLLEQALKDERADESTHELAVSAQGIAQAAQILTTEFALVATNVPFLGREKQSETLKSYVDQHYPTGRTDLACAMLKRSLDFCQSSGRAATVSPQYWLFLGRYKGFRRSILESDHIAIVARLGSGAFETIGGEVVNACLTVIGGPVDMSSQLACIDVSMVIGPDAKAAGLISCETTSLSQEQQKSNPDTVIGYQADPSKALLQEYCYCYQGLATSDNAQFICQFWELPIIQDGWVEFQMAPDRSQEVIGGHSWLLRWEDGNGRYARHAEALKAEGRLGGWRSGYEAWGKRGVAINRMGDLHAALYGGAMFDCNVAVVIPHKAADLPWLWSYLRSESYAHEVRRLTQKASVTNLTLIKVPVDRDSLIQELSSGAENLDSHSDDPTQWLVNGHPKGADEPLQVAVARLLGYQWPRQSGSSFPDCPALGPDGLEKYADRDGIVCLSPLNREQPAVSRLRALLAASFGKDWSAGKEHDVLAATGSDSSTLEEWLRDEFFEQHCALFHHRPFIWHIWDGRKDGFHALVNYHRLDNATLQKVTYSYLGDWMRQQEQDAKADKPGAAERLGAAKTLQAELAKILEGEPPYDVFVRWKPLKEQPLGWQPDLNDGVRLNIRPFMQAKDVGKKGAGLLQTKPNIKWEKDRGKEPERSKADFPWFWSAEEPPTDYQGGKEFTGHRWTDVHCSIAIKKKARAGAGR